MADLVPPAEIAEVTTLLNAPYANTFGATETGCPPCSSNLIPVGVAPTRLSKQQSPFCEVQLVDAEDRDVPDGEPGELCMRGPTLFSGYWRAPETNAKDFRGGWFHMGDVFVRNPDGTLDFVDRVKYLIKSGGENIYPAEIERVLLQDKRVADAAVVRKRDPEMGRGAGRLRRAPRRGADGGRAARPLPRAARRLQAAQGNPFHPVRRLSAQRVGQDPAPRAGTKIEGTMSSEPDAPTTSIASHSPEDVFIRGTSLCKELIGQRSFTEVIYFQILGRMPTPDQAALIDACLVALMEHGLTPSVLAARLTYSSAPEALQGAVAAGLLGVGSRFVGSMEGCAALLQRIVDAEDGVAEATRIAVEHRAARTALPGFGHPTHKPDDPRAQRLLELARERKVAGRHVAAIAALSAAVDATYGRHITINATGAIAAVLGDCGVPAEIARGFGLIARCAGLVGHLYEEQQKPTLRAIWEAAEQAVPYEAKK